MGDHLLKFGIDGTKIRLVYRGSYSDSDPNLSSDESKHAEFVSYTFTLPSFCHIHKCWSDLINLTICFLLLSVIIAYFFSHLEKNKNHILRTCKCVLKFLNLCKISHS